MPTEKQLQVAVVGGLGLMSSPMAKHWQSKDSIRVLRVQDRNKPGTRRDKCRKEWKAHGAELLPTIEKTIGSGDLDGVFVCAGKNGDDLAVIAEIANYLAINSAGTFICHLSTVSTNFVKAAYEFCSNKNIHYVNYPLTGGPIGAENASMLILASGDLETYKKLTAALSLIGKPRYFGSSITAGAEVKLMGHLMVFNGLVGICSAAAVHAESLNNGQLGGQAQVDFFDYLNQGAGGTKQWDVILSFGIKKDIWDMPFFIRHAVVDAIYAAQMCMDYKVSWLTIQPIINTALAFSYVVNKINPDLATHAIVREMLSKRALELDNFIIQYSRAPGKAKEAIEKCIESLPVDVRATVALNITAADFSKALSTLTKSQK